MVGRSLLKLVRRHIFLSIFLLFSVVVYYNANVQVIGTYQWKNRLRCKTSEVDMNALKELLRLTSQALTELNLTHVLSYGSLWGSLRYNDPLPWDYDFDLSVLHDDLVKVNEEDFMNKFRSLGVDIRYSPYAGNYKVTNGFADGDIMIWRDWYGNGMMTRIGYESYYLFLHHRMYHRFPSRLVKTPLPVLKFAGINFSAPREGIEIQKYLYPTNWWKEVLPGSC